MAVLTELLTTE